MTGLLGTQDRAMRSPPRHIAIIMDGNGRWADARGLPRIAGHRRGAEAVRRTVSGAIELGIPYLTLFGFSSENWKRSAGEIGDLMGLLRHYLLAEIAELHRRRIRLQVIGQLVDDVISQRRRLVVARSGQALGRFVTPIHRPSPNLIRPLVLH